MVMLFPCLKFSINLSKNLNKRDQLHIFSVIIFVVIVISMRISFLNWIFSEKYDGILISCQRLYSTYQQLSSTYQRLSKTYQQLSSTYVKNNDIVEDNNNTFINNNLIQKLCENWNNNSTYNYIYVYVYFLMTAYLTINLINLVDCVNLHNGLFYNFVKNPVQEYHKSETTFGKERIKS